MTPAAGKPAATGKTKAAVKTPAVKTAAVKTPATASQVVKAAGKGEPRTIRVLSVASEIYPLVKTGGLADVVGALPGALAAQGVAMETLVPGYPRVLEALEPASVVHTWTDLFGASARLLHGRAGALDLVVLDAPHLFARTGNPYVGPDGRDWPDNAFRFAALARAAADVGLGRTMLPRPDVVHAHDWQAALAPAYLHYAGEPRPGTVVTVHNLAFQGQFPEELAGPLGFPRHAWSVDGIEYYGTVGYLKAGLQLADRITTVSPTYAAEIMESEAGMGLDGLLRSRAQAVTGILNGIDTSVWDPASDPLLPAAFDAQRPKAKGAVKAALQQRLGLSVERDSLVFGVVSRLSWQKGLDLLLGCLGALVESGAQLALLGAGEPGLEQGFLAAQARWPGRIGCQLGYDEGLAHLIQGGSDAILVPSRFEPCGLTQLCALRYGTVPVVARVGGLADTVVDANEMALAAGVATGLHVSPITRDRLDAGIRRAAALWKDQPAWRRLQKNGMATDVSWTHPARRYAALYRDVAPPVA